MENSLNIDWQSDESHSLVSPGMEPVSNETLKRYSGFLFINTSGSLGTTKRVAITKAAMLHAARSVNSLSKSDEFDRWGMVLPEWHIGGLSIFARSSLTNSTTIKYQGYYSALGLYEFIRDEEITIISLVPTQLYDLLSLGKNCPPSLRVVFVGGQELKNDLYLKAREYLYPVLPSYGMTETGAMLACAPLDSLSTLSNPKLELLSHIEARSTDSGEADSGELEFRGPSLFAGYLSKAGEIVDPKIEGWFRSSDLGSLSIEGESTIVEVSGRSGRVVKRYGVALSLGDVEEKLKKQIGKESLAVTASKEGRSGIELTLWIEDDMDLSCKALNEKLPGLYRISHIRNVTFLPKTPLGKLRYNSLED